MAESQQQSGFASTATAGTGWTSAQAVINKFLTVGAMWVVALRLTPDEFGMAAFTLAAGVFLVILPPLTVGDVAVTHRRRFALIAPMATRLALYVGVASMAVIAIAAPIVAAIYDKYPTGILTGLIWVVALRPVGDALATIPLSHLRLGFDYRTIALVDGSIQLVATTATVVMAFLGCSALSLVLPQVVACFAKAVMYRSKQRADTSSVQARREWTPRHSKRVRGRIAREFALAAIAQYAHNILVLLPVPILAYFSTEEQTGFFAFAFMLSAQANGLIASQLGTVLQPIFERIGTNMQRQVDGFLRVVRVIGAVAVPVVLLQAALAAPLFSLLFEEKWQGAIASFAVLSLMEGCYFATAPTMALLRAQGRFATYFVWQATHFALSVVAYCFAAKQFGALGVAACAAILWAISLPIAVRLCIGGRAAATWTAARVFIAPWLTAAPIALGVWVAWLFLQPLGTVGMILALVVVGPLGLVAALAATRFSQPSAYAELVPMAKKMTHRILRRSS